MLDAICFVKNNVKINDKINDFNIIATIYDTSELINYKNITVIVRELNIFGDILDILNIKEKYLKPNNLGIFIYDDKILISDWSDENSAQFETYAMVSYMSTIDENIINNICNKVTNYDNKSWNENISLFHKMLNK